MTHLICSSCVLTILPPRDDRTHDWVFPETGTCCWCGEMTEIMLVSTSLDVPTCPGHDDPVEWTLEDYARAVITEYRLGRAGQISPTYAPADILGDTTLHQAINALEEVL